MLLPNMKISVKKSKLLKYFWRAKTNTINGHSWRGKFSEWANCDKLWDLV